jgi:hypothetical protein
VRFPRHANVGEHREIIGKQSTSKTLTLKEEPTLLRVLCRCKMSNSQDNALTTPEAPNQNGIKIGSRGPGWKQSAGDSLTTQAPTRLKTEAKE